MDKLKPNRQYTIYFYQQQNGKWEWLLKDDNNDKTLFILRDLSKEKMEINIIQFLIYNNRFTKIVIENDKIIIKPKN